MDYPKLRPIEVFPVALGGRDVICLRDPTQLADDAVLVPRETLFLLAHFDGKHSILDIQEAYTRQYGQLLYSDAIGEVIDKLDEHLLLDSERFAAYKRQLSEGFRRSPARCAAHAGTAYEADPMALRRQLAGYFADPAGPGSAAALAIAGPVRGILAPHIDPRRGGPYFAWAYEAIRQVTADVFVIFGTAHQPTSVPFPLTLKDYETPLGMVQTDKTFVRDLARRICGFPPTYMLLRTMPATAGTVLKYDQAIEPATQSMVSYASVVFH